MSKRPSSAFRFFFISIAALILFSLALVLADRNISPAQFATRPPAATQTPAWHLIDSPPEAMLRLTSQAGTMRFFWTCEADKKVMVSAVLNVRSGSSAVMDTRNSSAAQVNIAFDGNTGSFYRLSKVDEDGRGWRISAAENIVLLMQNAKIMTVRYTSTAGEQTETFDISALQEQYKPVKESGCYSPW
ncbi:hypothetical protein FBQ95_17280 [Chloroflexi bacterium CFX3]|nr:hypothetical protein [Chloroflexi bacterium CFX3]